uniref:Uncharacterized protein n=2 Tax=Caenorhabditis japonica TaxID=281687 RepID=A0A8R1IGK7_CAEJA
MAEQDERDRLLSLLGQDVMERMLPKVKEMLANKEEEKAPEIGQKGLMVQAELNAKMINMLRAAMDEEDPKKGIKDVIETLRQRNTELQLLDRNPN